MGFFDDLSSAVNRGASAASRATDSMKMKYQQDDLIRQRQRLAAQLGASLYEQTKNDPAMRQGRESLYDAIAAIDEKRAKLQQDIDKANQEGNDAAQAARTYTCPQCGATVWTTDSFCSGCGKPVSEIIAAANAGGSSQA